MGSNYFGDCGSSSRKGKKSISEKPKQPQRGLGVAQLEKIRLHSELGCTFLPSVHHNPYLIQDDMRLQTPHSASSSFSYSSSSSPPYPFQPHHGVMIGLPDLDRAGVVHGDFQPINAARWHPDNAGYETQPSMTRPFFEPPLRDSLSKEDGSSSHNSESQDVDLELRLSI